MAMASHVISLMLLLAATAVNSRIVVHSSQDEVLQRNNNEDSTGHFDFLSEDPDFGGYDYDSPAVPCDNAKCKLPDCRCSGTHIPGGFKPSDTPQMVVLTFSNAVRRQDVHLYHELFANRTNPNGCPATGTFYVSHKYSDYYDVQLLYSQRHEIGNNGVSEKTIDFWSNGTCASIMQQIKRQSRILSTFGGINASDIRGFRTPFLYFGGDALLCAEVNASMKYDATRIAVNYKDQPNLVWPYTYDYLSTQNCTYGKCSDQRHPGFWQFPLEALVDSKGFPCADLASCAAKTEDQAYTILLDGFQARYSSNRAPMMLEMKVDWLLSDYKMAATKKFLDYMHNFTDVYVVSAWQALKWIEDPSVRQNMSAFSCDKPAPKVCAESQANTCQYDANGKLVHTKGVIVTRTCQKCPAYFPTGNSPIYQSSLMTLLIFVFTILILE